MGQRAMAKKQNGFMSVPIEEIDPELRPASQTRVKLDELAVKEYGDRIDLTDPVCLTFDPSTRKHWVDDGAHRISAARNKGRTEVNARVATGTYEEAMYRACRANEKNGVRVTDADKRHRVQEALRHPAMKGRPQREIAELCAVTQPYVSKIVGMALDNSYQVPSGPSDNREDKIARIETALRDPKTGQCSNEEIAEICDVHRKTVGKVRNRLIEAGEISSRATKGTGKIVVTSGGTGAIVASTPTARQMSNGKATPVIPATPAPSLPTAPPAARGDPPKQDHPTPEPSSPTMPQPINWQQRWEEVEKTITDLYHSWPEEVRGNFVFKLLGFASSMQIRFHPEIEVYHNQPLLK